MCRLADLPCVVLKGYDKRTVSYEVGENPKEEHVSLWNAVHVDGSWRLMDPVMAFTGVTAKDAPDWVFVEDSGQALRERYRNLFYLYIHLVSLLFKFFAFLIRSSFGDPVWLWGVKIPKLTNFLFGYPTAIAFVLPTPLCLLAHHFVFFID